jgi:hypothetical protein
MSRVHAVVRDRRPLLYRRGADPAQDRPAHVRAASGLAWWRGHLVVVQDDARFLGFVDPTTGWVDDVVLEAGPDGRRVFDAGLGNKKQKPDFELVFVVGDLLVTLGSGGPLAHRRTLLVWNAGDDAPREHVAERLHQALTDRHVRSGTALNLEGGETWDGRVVLAQRGGDQGAPDLLITTDAETFRAFLEDPAHAPVPETTATEVELGALDGHALRFTDLTAGGWFSAAAEVTDSYFDDGAVAGSVVGRLSPDRRVEVVATVVDGAGARTTDKVEGLVPTDREGTFWAVTDPDDPAVPGELLLLALEG